MPSNSKRPTPAPTNLPKQSPAMNTSMKSGSKSGSAVNSSNTGAAKPKSGPSAASGGEPSAEASEQQKAAQPSFRIPEVDAPAVNRKKQKRRKKQAARLVVEQHRLDNGYSSAYSQDQSRPPSFTRNIHGEIDRRTMGRPITGMEPDYIDDYVEVDRATYEPYDGEDLYYTDEEGRLYAPPRDHGQFGKDGFGNHNHGPESRNRKRTKGKKTLSSSHEKSTSHSTPSISARPPPPPLSNAVFRSAHKISKDRIWNTSTQEERENIKDFWLHLGEEERRSLVKVEKEAVLRKMKEQQKHSCSCTVCGRKRTAIEEELEVLYDAYYEELEQYAHHNQGSLENGAPIVPPPRLYRPPLRSPLDRHSHISSSQYPPRGRIQELPDDDDEEEGMEEEEEEYEYDEDDEDDEPYSDDDLDDHARTTRADFFAFGNSLTVKDGILTVADDLLKNDGKHFIDMMEQLAERRMQREEDTQYASASAAHHMHSGHNHGPPLDEEDYDEEDEEDYDSQEEEEFEEDDMDAMTEEQRMEEGRRMFQIFAARMFEQRVLTAYREKVARERQQKLIEELEEENRLGVEREAKKAREAQKKKDKKRLQKQAKEEERAKREAEKAAEEAAAKALEEKKLEEQRKRKEEQRKKKEAERKAQEEERARKEAERIKERERQAELERKQREQKEREKKKREEAKKKARDERETKEKESREKKAKEEMDRKAREEQAMKEKEAAVKAEREAKELARRDEQAAQQAHQTTAHAPTQAAKRMSQSGPVPLPPGLQHPQGPSAFHSPHLPFATPVVPKAPTPVRPRQTSHQGSHTSSPRSQKAGTELSQTSISPENLPFSHSSATSSSASFKGHSQQPILHHPQPSAPMSPLGASGRGHPSMGFNAMPASNGIPSNPPGIPGMAPRPPMGYDIPMGAHSQSGIGGQFRNFAGPNSIPIPPGINGNRPMGGSRGFPMDPSYGLPPYQSQPPVPMPISTHHSHLPRDGGRSKTHSRQESGSFERSPLDQQTQTMPISRPAPIQRPPSAAPSGPSKNQQQKSSTAEVDDLSTQLGSSALLDDTDVPLTSSLSQSLPTAAPGAPGAPGSGRLGFAAPPPLFTDPMGMSKQPNFPLASGNQGATWAAQMPFAPSGFPGASSWGASPGAGWSNNAFGTIGGPHRLHMSRPVSIRLMVSQACKHLTSNSPIKGNTGFHSVNVVLQKVEQLKSPNEPAVTLKEMLEICDTEGNPQNGGGSFIIKNEGNQGPFVKFEPDNNSAPSGGRGSLVPGDIGSPVPGGSVPAFGGNIGSGAAGPRQFSPQANISPPTGY